LQTALRLSSDPAVRAELANAYAASGDREQAVKLLNDLLHAPPQVHVRAYDLAMVYTGLGDKDEAFRFLRKAAEQREAAMNNINVHPRFAILRGDPRFADLQRQIGLLKK
jgi:Tfp pilus assembly protein PilF